MYIKLIYTLIKETQFLKKNVFVKLFLKNTLPPDSTNFSRVLEIKTFDIFYIDTLNFGLHNYKMCCNN